MFEIVEKEATGTVIKVVASAVRAATRSTT